MLNISVKNKMSDYDKNKKTFFLKKSLCVF